MEYLIILSMVYYTSGHLDGKHYAKLPTATTTEQCLKLAAELQAEQRVMEHNFRDKSQFTYVKVDADKTVLVTCNKVTLHAPR